MMRKWLRLWKTKRMQTGAIRYRQSMKLKIMHRSLTSLPDVTTPMTEISPPLNPTPRRNMNLRRIIYLLVIPCRILLLILTPLLRYLRRSNWECCRAS